jgi:anti-sigma-K factor RskA
MTTDDTDFNMPMDDLPLPSDSLLGLIQPYIADELPPAERARVDARLADDPQLRDIIAEQRAIRQDLRDMSPEAAPQALRARVLLELDSVDRERASERPAAPQPGPWQRLRALLRGAAVMIPASATAVALFLVVRTDPAPTVAVADVATTNAPIVVGRDNGAVHPAVRLVGASVDAARSPAIRTLAVGDRRVLDRQDPAGGLVPGNAREFRGQRFWLGHLGDRPAVAFEVGGVRHTLTAADGPRLRDDLEFLFLLEIGDQLRAASRP